MDSFLRTRRRAWTFDTAFRYLEACAVIRHAQLASPLILDVGSSGVGLSVYLKTGFKMIVELDASYPSWRLSSNQVQGRALQLPFCDKAFDVVTSMDMLEHVPPLYRPDAIEEMMRVTSKLFILAFPTGHMALKQDTRLAAEFWRVTGEEFRFVEEHLQNGLPSVREVATWLDDSMNRLNRLGDISVKKSANLRIRWVMMKWMIDQEWSATQKIAMVMMPWLRYLSFGECYRTFLVVSVS